MQKSKKRNITNIISEILGLSEETNGPIPTFSGFNQSNESMQPFRSANLGAKTGGCENMELSTGTMNAGFSCAKVLLDSAKPAQNGTETKKKPLEIPNLEPNDEFRSKRLKGETESKSFSFVSGVNLLGMRHDQEPEQTGTNTINGSEPSRHMAPDLYPITAETFSGIGDFSPVKFSPQKVAPTLNQTYDVLPLHQSETRTGTMLSSTMRPEISTNQKLEEAFTGDDILNLTFSDISLLSQSNEVIVAQSGTEIGTNDEITLTQFLTQYPGNATPHLATENMYHLCQNRNQFIAYPELSSKRSNQIPNENSISLETSKNVTTYNQTKFELELQDLISENETETMDSVHFPQPPVVQSTNQNSPEGTQYSNLDLFTPLQDRDTFTPKVELTFLESGIDQEHTDILANESLTNFDESDLSFRSELRVIPATPSTRDASQSPTLVAEETPNTITKQNGTNRSFDFSHLTDLIYSGTNSPVGCSSAPLECHTSLFTPKANT